MPFNQTIKTITDLRTAASGAVSTIYDDNLTANRVFVSTSAGKAGVSSITTTELGYLASTTGAIQTQINDRIPKNTYGTTGDILYASSSGTPTPIHIGPSGYLLQSNGLVPDYRPDRRIMQQMLFDGVMSSGSKKGMMVIQQPYANKNLVFVHVAVDGSGTTGTARFQLQRNRITGGNPTLTNMLTTIVSVDSLEFGSETAATPYVIDTNNDDVLVNDRIYINVTGIHDTPASGVIITLGFE
jgi:hypothetical protein